MRIIVIGKSAYTYKENGTLLKPILAGHTLGLTAQLVPYLISKGHKVCFLCPANKGIEEITTSFEVYPPEQLTIKSFKGTRFPKVFQSSDIDSFLEAFGSSKNSLGGLDWVISIYGFPFAIYVEIARFAFNFRHMVALRGGDGYKFVSEARLCAAYGNSEGQDYLIKTYHECLRRSDRILAASEWLAMKVKEHGIKVDDILPTPPMLYNKTENNCLTKASKIINSNSLGGHADSEKKWLLAAGRFSVDKRFDLLLEAFAKWQTCEWQVVIAGQGNELEKLKRCASELSISDNVCFTTIPSHQMGLVMNHVKAFVHICHLSDRFEDARPNVVTTAAYYGLPVILPHNVGGSHESVSKENVEFFSYVDSRNEGKLIQNITDALSKLENSSARIIVGKSNRDFTKSLSPDQVFSNLEKLLT